MKKDPIVVSAYTRGLAMHKVAEEVGTLNMDAAEVEKRVAAYSYPLFKQAQGRIKREGQRYTVETYDTAREFETEAEMYEHITGQKLHRFQWELLRRFDKCKYVVHSTPYRAYGKSHLYKWMEEARRVWCRQQPDYADRVYIDATNLAPRKRQLKAKLLRYAQRARTGVWDD